MFKFNIKTRIVVFVVAFELIAFGAIQLFNHVIYKKELMTLKTKEISQFFHVANEKINSMSLLMERNAIHLAEVGERLYQIKRQQKLSDESLIQEFKQTLISNFRGFPEAIGGGIWYQPYIYDGDQKYFGPYAFNSDKGIEFTWDLSNETYDYHLQDWYQLAIYEHWGKSQQTYKPVIWTPPYIDAAATHSYMMTVDAIMYDHNRQPIGMATVDWSLESITKFITNLTITDNTLSFLIHEKSQQIVSFDSMNGEATNWKMQSWYNQLFSTQAPDQLEIISNITLAKQPYHIYYTRTKSGFVFGSLIPVSDLEKEIDEITWLTQVMGTVIGITLLIILLIVLRYLFSSFDKVLTQIKASITHDDDAHVEVQAIEYYELNEFTPIINALNEVYEQINKYISDISLHNARLKVSKLEVKRLNEQLEFKVKQRTEQLKQKTEEAQASLAHLQSTQQQLIEQEKHASLGRLVAGVSHEINTPLGISITAASCIVREVDAIDKKVKDHTLKKSDFDQAFARILESIQVMDINLKRTSELVNSFKQVAVEQSIDDFSLFNLGDYLTKKLMTLKPRVNQAGHHISFAIPTQSISLFSNPGAISLVVSNIVDNALMHGFTEKQQGDIFIDVQQRNNKIDIIVSDNGCGMNEEVLALIFDPFFTTSRSHGSSGLGMHIVYNLVTQHLQGHIECKSEQGQGTQFIITLPHKTSSQDDIHI